MSDVFTNLNWSISSVPSVRTFGKVLGIHGLSIKAGGLEDAALGSRCLIIDRHENQVPAEVVGFDGDAAVLMAFAPLEGIGPGCKVYPLSHHATTLVGPHLLGRVVDGLGNPLDNGGPIQEPLAEVPLKAPPPEASTRAAVGAKLDVGVRTVNTFVPLCLGQRMGIFSGSGVGKSVLLAMMAKFTTADVIVIGLIGERGREVREFIDEQLGPEGLQKSVVVVATGDQPALLRRQAAYTTMATAEYFRNQGKNVLLLMDSVTRFAMAQREIGLSAGEPPTTRGYTPSVFSELPRLLERAGPGTAQQGTITAVFTVLVEGGDMDEPVADAVRGIVDGHIILTRALAERGHFPAIDVLKSVSRMVPQCNSEQENVLVNTARQHMATFNDMAELIRLGAYARGSDPSVDAAIHYQDLLDPFLRQAPEENSTITDGFGQLDAVLAQPAPAPHTTIADEG